jgi:phage-related protein
MLLTFKNIQGQRFDQAVTASLDLAAGFAAASGSSLNMKSATIQLGKALNDPIAGMSALTRVGVQFTEQQTKQITKLVESGNLYKAQGIILTEVNSQFAGSAKAQATATGAMSVAFENLAEVVGGLVAPAFKFLAEQLGSILEFLQTEAPAAWEAFKEGVTNAWNAIKPFAETLGGVLLPLLETAWHTIKDRLIPALDRIKPLLIVIGGAILVLVTLAVAQFALMVTAFSFVLDKFLDFVGFIRDKVVEPVVNFLGRIVEAIKGPLIGAWNFLKEAVGRIVGPIVGFIQDIIDKVGTLIEWIKDAINWLKEFFASAEAPFPTKGGLVGGTGAPIPGAQHGGIVTRSGLAMIHRGEAISGVNNEMGFGINGDIVLQVSGQTFARITRDELRKLGNRNAGTGL